MTASFSPDRSASTFRKIAAAMWGAPNDPTIYGVLDLDAVPVLEAVEALRAKTGVKVTVTHVVARAVALMFRNMPEVNAKVRWWGKIEKRNQVDIFLQVAVEGGKDLSGVRIADADKKGIVDLAREIQAASDKIRKSDDPTYQKSRGLFGWLPWLFVRPILRLTDFLVNELHFDLKGSGMPRDPFGCAMVTSLGMHGVDFAFAPFTPIARCPFIVLVTETKKRPWVKGDQVVAHPVLRCCATFDHRVIDGAHAAKMSQEFARLLSDRETLHDLAVGVAALPGTGALPGAGGPGGHGAGGNGAGTSASGGMVLEGAGKPTDPKAITSKEMGVHKVG